MGRGFCLNPANSRNGGLPFFLGEMQRVTPSCAHCGADGTSACCACFTTFYCSQRCQAAAWPAHKGEGAGGCAPANLRRIIRETGDTPLHLCVKVNALEALGLMVTLGISPEVRNRAGLTGLMQAALEAKLDAMACLLDGGADVDATHTIDGVPFSALTKALLCARECPELGVPAVALLIARGAKCTEVELAMARDRPALLGMLEGAPFRRAQRPANWGGV